MSGIRVTEAKVESSPDGDVIVTLGPVSVAMSELGARELAAALIDAADYIAAEAAALGAELLDGG